MPAARKAAAFLKVPAVLCAGLLAMAAPAFGQHIVELDDEPDMAASAPPAAVVEVAEPADWEPAEPIRPAFEEEDDPFAALGVRAGSFILYPSIDALAGYTDNAGRRAGPAESAMFFTLAPELLLRSDWARHSFNMDLRGRATRFKDTPIGDELFAEGRAEAGLEITSHTAATLFVNGSVTREEDITDRVLGGGAGLTHRFNRLSVGLRGQVQDFDYGTRTTSLGSAVRDDVADYRMRELGLRASYEMSDNLSLFADGALNKRVFAQRVDPFGTIRGSKGFRAVAGATFAPTGKLSGEIAVGYLQQRPDEPAFGDIGAFLLDASLRWAPTGLTVVNLALATDIGETTLAGSSGYVSRTASIDVEHALRRYLLLRAGASYRLADFQGVPVDEQTIIVSAGADYLLGRSLALTGGVSREWFKSSVAGADYDAFTVFAGVRLRR